MTEEYRDRGPECVRSNGPSQPCDYCTGRGLYCVEIPKDLGDEIHQALELDFLERKKALRPIRKKLKEIENAQLLDPALAQIQAFCQARAQSLESRSDNSQVALHPRSPVYVEPMTQVNIEPIPPRPRIPTYVHPTTQVDIEPIPPLNAPAPRPTVMALLSDVREELERADFAAVRAFLNALYLRRE
ncbi:hypothetical protein PoHVEF18_009077 [Penicillium ochrochloron]